MRVPRVAGQGVQQGLAGDDVPTRRGEQTQHLQTAGRQRQDPPVQDGAAPAHLQAPGDSLDPGRALTTEVGHQCAHEGAEASPFGNQEAMPASSSGAAVTGPTAAATRSRDAHRRRISSRNPQSRATVSQAWAPGADVKTTASTSPTAVARTEASSATGSGGGPSAVDDEAGDVLRS